MYHTVLWDLHEVDGPIAEQENPNKFEIKEHETLQEAVKYLIKNGANFDNQEIMQVVDWLPNGEANVVHQPPQAKTVELDPGPPPGTVMGPVEQPMELNPRRTTADGVPLSPSQKLSALGFLPPMVRNAIVNDE